MRSLRVFISYSHREKDHREELVAHLSASIQDGTLEVWDDVRIRGGADWRAEILAALERADVVMPLVSPWFLASPECQAEMEIAWKLHDAGKLRVMPVRIRQVDLGRRLGSLQFLSGDRPVPASGEARDEAFARIAAKLREIAAEVRAAIPRTEEEGATNLTERWNSLALRLADQGHPREALEILEETIGIHWNGQREQTEDFAALLSNRGLVRQDLGDVEGARQDLERASKISEEILGPDHPVVARRLAYLGGALLELGEEERARRLLERAFAILEVTAASRNPDLFLACLHLGDALESEPRRARELLERILDEASKEPKAAAAAHSTLGRIAFREGLFRDARNRFRQAVEIGEKSYKKGHPFVGIDLHNLGLTLRALGSLDKARGVLRRALDILIPRLSAGSPRVRWTEKALALVVDAAASAPE